MTPTPWLIDSSDYDECRDQIISSFSMSYANLICQSPSKALSSYKHWEANADAIVCAINNSYGKGLDPNAYVSVFNMLEECVSQIEYLHSKFKETGSGNSVLSRAKGIIENAKFTQ